MPGSSPAGPPQPRGGTGGGGGGGYRDPQNYSSPKEWGLGLRVPKLGGGTGGVHGARGLNLWGLWGL